MTHTLISWLAGLVQAIKVWITRIYYRASNAWAWRNNTYPGPFTDLEIPVGDTCITGRLYNNALGSARPLIVYIHGGGWVIGDLETHHAFCQNLSQASGCSVLALGYRLAPEHPFPAAPDDCLAATRWIARHVAQLGCNNQRLVIAGDSAGGNLTTCTCLELDPASREKVAGEVLIYPATDHYSAGFRSYVERAKGQALTANITIWFWDTYLGDLSAEAPAAARAFPLRSTKLASLPPTLLVTAEKDPLRDEGKAYAEALQAQGVAVNYAHYASAQHGFACSEGPHADFRRFMKQLTDWLSELD